MMLLSQTQLQRRREQVTEHEAKRIIHGVRIPEMTKAEIERWYGIPEDAEVYTSYQGPDVWILPFIAEVVTSLYVLVDDRSIPKTALDRSTKAWFGVERWYQAYENLGSRPNGQVKNFFVALRTYSLRILGEGTPAMVTKVCLKGSKSMEGGGRWIQYYGFFLLRSHQAVELDCYDLGEAGEDEKYSIVHEGKTRTLIIRHIPKFYYGKGEGYTVVVDDAFTTTDPGVKVVAYESRYFSRKNQAGKVEPFLHATEGRDFSHALVDGQVKPECPCRVCYLSASLSKSYGDYVFIRGIAVLMGYPLCFRTEFSVEMQAKASMLVALLTQPTVQISTGLEVRAVMSLMDEMKIQALTAREVQRSLVGQSGVGRDSVVRNEGFQVRKTVAPLPELAGKVVVFRGVSPSILGSTRVQTKEMSTLNRPQYVSGDVLFCGTYDAALTVSFYDSIWYPSEVPIPGYKPSGRSWPPFVEYVRLPVLDQRVASTVVVKGSRPGYWSHVVTAAYERAPGTEGFKSTGPSTDYDSTTYEKPFCMVQGKYAMIGYHPFVYDETGEERRDYALFTPFERWADDRGALRLITLYDSPRGYRRVIYSQTLCSYRWSGKYVVQCKCGMSHYLRGVWEGISYECYV